MKHIKIEDDDERNVQLYSSEEAVYLTKKNQKFKNEFYDLTKIHSILVFRHGNLQEEYPEQCLTCQFIRPHDIVLEIGGNIGRNSCIIASILNDSSNLSCFGVK